MAPKRTQRTQLSVYIPREARETRLIERLEELARRRRRSLNFLVIEAIARYLQEAERSERDQDV
jgi:predicted transcriptional regulator